MGIFPSLISRSKYGPTSDYWYFPVGQPTAAGVNVSEAEALKYLTVFSCVSLISGDVARLPLNLYRKRKDSGKDIVLDHPLFDLLHNVPNPETTSFNFRESAQGHLLLWGNTFAHIERDKAGKINNLWLLPDPSRIEVFRKNNQILYQYKVDDKTVVRTRDEIFHIPGYGFNGLYGMSMISLAREAIGVGLAAETFGARFFGAGTHPAGLLTMPPEAAAMDPEEQKKYIAMIKDQYSSLGNSHNIMFLPNGEKYQSLTMPMEDSQFLETRDHQKIEICGMYHVPPHKIAIHGQNSNYNNLEQENASYVDSCLMHWLVRWESCINQQLLTAEERRSGLFFEFLVAGLLRGDSTARADYYNKLFQIGGLTPNEIRSKENMNPLENGDEPFVMLNMVPLKDAGRDVPMPGDEPEPAEDIDADDEDRNNGNSSSAYRAFFSPATHQRSITMRDRIARQYAPLIRDAAVAIVNKESKAIKAKVAVRGRNNDIMADFLKEFYAKFPEYIERKMGPILRSFMIAIGEEAGREIGLNDTEFVEPKIKEYIAWFAQRYSDSHINQMLLLLESDDLAEVEKRADEWIEKQPDKVVNDETVRASNAAYTFVAIGFGLGLIWHTRGKDSCPYCKELDGRRVSAGKAFINAGDELKPDGDDDESMKVYGMKTHPPLHGGCMCYVSMG